MAKAPQTKNLLKQLASWAMRGLIIAVELQRYQKIYLAGGGHAQVVELKNWRNRHNQRRKLYELKRSKYITTKKQGAKLIISLTAKGERAVLVESLRQAPLCPRDQSTLVIFDIPEQVKKARQVLRRLLKDVGFKQLQKSVWITNRDVVPQLNSFLKERRLHNWVQVFRAELERK